MGDNHPDLPENKNNNMKERNHTFEVLRCLDFGERVEDGLLPITYSRWRVKMNKSKERLTMTAGLWPAAAELIVGEGWKT